MKRRFRLTRSTDFERVRRTGKSYAHPLVVLVASPNAEEKIRVGVVAGLKVGGAVQRNRARRRMRAVIHDLLPSLQPGWDLIFIARQPISEARFEDIQAAIARLLRRAGILVLEGTLRSSNGNERAAGLSK